MARQRTEYPEIVDDLLSLYDGHRRRAFERELRQKRDQTPDV